MQPKRILTESLLSEYPFWPEAAEDAFARWCAERNLIEDYDAPHGQAFLAGWLAMARWESPRG